MTQTPADTTPPADGLPPRQRYLAMVAVGLAVSMTVLDGTMVSVALPVIAQDLDSSAAATVWVIKAYQLAVICSLLPLAALGEVIGYRWIYQGGLLVFTLAALACAVADNLTALAITRTIQGFGAAGIMSVNTALVRYIYPRALLGRGIGLSVLIVAVSAGAGPTVAAVILLAADWPWLFAVNAPLGLLSLLIGARALPYTPRTAQRFDLRSALLNALFFGVLIAAVGSLGRDAWSLTAVLWLAAAACGWILVRRQLAMTAPLLPVDLLKIPVFALSIVTSICSFCAHMLAFIALPFYLQQVLGRSPVETGFLMTPWAVLTAMASPLAGRLADRYPAGLLGGIGLAILFVGLILLALLPVDASNATIVWRMALCGAGFALFQTPNNRTLVTSAPRDRISGASGMIGTARLFGQIFGAALAGLVFGLAGAHGNRLTLMLAAGFAGAAALASSLRLLPRDAPEAGGPG